MSIVYLIDKTKGVTFVHWNGTVTADEILTHVSKLTMDPNWPSSRRVQIADMRHVRADASINDSTLEKAVDFFIKDLEKIDRFKLAFVARDEFAKARRFQELIAKFGPTVIVFNSMDTACIWLGIDIIETEKIFKQLRSPADSQEPGHAIQ